MNTRLQKSKDFTEEYCCSVVKVGELVPVENSDRLMQTRINGESIVVNKADVKEGDVMLYVSNECQINGWFLGTNNMYRHYTLNANKDEVEKRIAEDPDFLKSDEGKAMVGYFEDNGRVKMIKLRGCPSFGVLFKPETLVKALMGMGNTEAMNIEWESLVGTDFDCIEWKHSPMMGDLKIDGYDDLLPFVRAYVPKYNEPRQHGMKGVSRWDRLNRMVPGQFKLHYDTAPLKKHLMDFNPKSEITVTVKMHGTSFICGNLLTNVPLRFFSIRRWLNEHLHTSIKESRQEYGMIVSSRKVIKNEWGGSDHPEGFYGQDIWTEYGNIIFPYLDRGLTVYGEICGYLTGNAKMIQQDYDYGCKQGENFLMLYRATKHEDGQLRELSIDEVVQMTDVIKARMRDADDKNVGRIFNIGGVRLYRGTIAQLLAGIGSVPDPAMNYDLRDFPDTLAQRCQIEDREPLCTGHNVPREGVVVRIEGDEVPEAFKLKSLAFLEREKKAIDKGEVDMEMEAVASE